MRYLISCGILFVVYLGYVNSNACIQCNSATDVKCAVSPEAFLAKECSNSSSKCYTRIEDGKTIRGCSAELDNATIHNCNNEMECSICTFVDGCNRQLFPEHRRSCLQCSGNGESSKCSTDIDMKPTYCPIYKLGDMCYIRNDGRNTENSVRRGCLSSIQAEGRCKNTSNCYTCDGNGCNLLELNHIAIPRAYDSATAYSASLLLPLIVVALSLLF